MLVTPDIDVDSSSFIYTNGYINITSSNGGSILNPNQFLELYIENYDGTPYTGIVRVVNEQTLQVTMGLMPNSDGILRLFVPTLDSYHLETEINSNIYITNSFSSNSTRPIVLVFNNGSTKKYVTRGIRIF